MTGTVHERSSVPSDPADLLDGIARGSVEMFAPFYDQLADRLFGVIVTVLRDPVLAEEVTQETFIELWRTAPRYSTARGTATTWAMTVARRRAIDCVRSEEARRRRERTATFEDSCSRPFDQPSETASDNAEWRQVQACIPQLTTLQQQSVWMAYYQGKTVSQIAEDLQIPPNTVKSRLRDSLRRLHECVQTTSAGCS